MENKYPTFDQNNYNDDLTIFRDGSHEMDEPFDLLKYKGELIKELNMWIITDNSSFEHIDQIKTNIESVDILMDFLQIFDDEDK